MPPAPKSDPPRRKTPSRFRSGALGTQGIAEAARWISQEINFATVSMTTAVSNRSPSHAGYRSAALGTIQDALSRFAGGRGDCPSPPMRSPSEPNQDGMTPMVADTAR